MKLFRRTGDTPENISSTSVLLLLFLFNVATLVSTQSSTGSASHNSSVVSALRQCYQYEICVQLRTRTVLTALVPSSGPSGITIRNQEGNGPFLSGSGSMGSTLGIRKKTQRYWEPMCECPHQQSCLLGPDEATGYGYIHHCRIPGPESSEDQELLQLKKKSTTSAGKLDKIYPF